MSFTAELRNYSELELQYLQSELAFNSSIVDQFISQCFRERGQSPGEVAASMRHHEEERKELLARVKTLEAEAVATRDEAAATNKWPVDAFGKRLRDSLATLKTEIESLKTELSKAAEIDNDPKHATVEEGLATVIDITTSSVPATEVDTTATLRAEVELLTKNATEDAALVEAKVQVAREEAIAKYKTSDDFYADMAEYQELALATLRDILVKDGKMEKDVISCYSYDVCMTCEDVSDSNDDEEVAVNNDKQK